MDNTYENLARVIAQADGTDFEVEGESTKAAYRTIADAVLAHLTSDDAVARAHEVLGVAWFEEGGHERPSSVDDIRAAILAALGVES